MASSLRFASLAHLRIRLQPVALVKRLEERDE